FLKLNAQEPDLVDAIYVSNLQACRQTIDGVEIGWFKFSSTGRIRFVSARIKDNSSQEALRTALSVVRKNDPAFESECIEKGSTVMMPVIETGKDLPAMDLQPYLRSLKVNSIFDTSLFFNEKLELSIDANIGFVKQKSIVSIDEQGLKAAAATAGGIMS